MAVQLKVVLLVTMLTSTAGISFSSAMQRPISRHAADNCACLGWQQAYINGATCDMGEQWCLGFLWRIPDAICMKTNLTTMNTTEPFQPSCFVSSSCQQLNGGKTINANFSMKSCVEGEDRMLGDLTPPDLIEFASERDLDIGFTARVAYTVSTTVWPWRTVKTHQTTPEQNAEVQKIQASGVPTLIDSADAMPPYAVIFGDKAYEMNLDRFYMLQSSVAGRSVFRHPNRMTTVTMNAWTADVCNCLPWQAGFSYNGTNCDWMGGVCNGFFMRFPHNHCVKIDGSTPNCLVVASCMELNGGIEINADVSLKSCVAGEDHMLGEIMPAEMKELSSRYGFDLVDAVTMAYPKASFSNWTDVRDHRATTEQNDEVRQIIASGVPTVIGSPNGLPPLAVIHGSTTYEITSDMMNVMTMIAGSSSVRPSETTWINTINFRHE